MNWWYITKELGFAAISCTVETGSVNICSVKREGRLAILIICFFLRVTEYVLDAANGVKRFSKIHWLCEFDDGVNDETWNWKDIQKGQEILGWHQLKYGQNFVWNAIKVWGLGLICSKNVLLNVSMMEVESWNRTFSKVENVWWHLSKLKTLFWWKKSLNFGDDLIALAKWGIEGVGDKIRNVWRTVKIYKLLVKAGLWWHERGNGFVVMIWKFEAWSVMMTWLDS
jgi:hypothetical protein